MVLYPPLFLWMPPLSICTDLFSPFYNRYWTFYNLIWLPLYTVIDPWVACNNIKMASRCVFNPMHTIFSACHTTPLIFITEKSVPFQRIKNKKQKTKIKFKPFFWPAPFFSSYIRMLLWYDWKTFVWWKSTSIIIQIWLSEWRVQIDGVII